MQHCLPYSSSLTRSNNMDKTTAILTGTYIVMMVVGALAMMVQ